MPTPKSGITLFLLSALSFAVTFAQSGSKLEKDVSNYATIGPAGSRASQQWIAETTVEAANRKFFNDLAEFRRLREEQCPTCSINEAITAYKERREELDGQGKWLGEAAKFDVNFAIAVAATATAGPAGTALAIAAQTAISQGTSLLVDGMLSGAKDDALVVLQRGMSQANANEINLMSTMKPGQIVEYLDEHGYVPLGLDDPELQRDQGARGVFLGFMAQRLENISKVSLNELAKQGAQLNDVEIKVDELQRTSKALWQTQQNLTQRMVRLENNVSEIQTGLSDLSQRTDKNESDIRYLQDALFSKMNPKEQLEALQNGFLATMPKEERDKLEEQVRLAEKRQEIIDDMNGYINTGGQLYNIASNLGVSGPFMDNAKTAIEVGQIAVEAFVNFSTGNYLGAISAVSNVLGIGRKGPDPAAERHQEIMNKLGELLAGQKRMDKKLDVIIETQKTIIQNQKAIFEAIVELSKQVQSQYESLMQRLDEIQTDVLRNREVILDGVVGDVKFCREIVKDAVSDHFDPNTMRFASIKLQQENFFNNREKYNPCIDTLFKVMAGLGDSDAPFMAYNWFLKNYQGDSVLKGRNQIEAFNDQVWNPAWNLYTSLVKTIDANTLIPLTNPVTTVSGILARRDAITKLKSSLTYPSRWTEELSAGAAPLGKLLGSYYSPEAIQYYSAHALRFYPYLDLRSPNKQRLKTIDELKKTSATANKASDAKTMLRVTASRLDLAIAQQSLLAGDALLPLMYDHFIKQERCSVLNNPTELANVANEGAFTKALEHNPTLARNFTMYAMRLEVTKTSGERENPFIPYHFAINSPTNLSASLYTVLANKNCFAFDRLENQIPPVTDSNNKPLSGWCWKLPGQCVPLPSAASLETGRLELRAELGPLGCLQSRALDEYLGYDFASKLSDQVKAGTLSDQAKRRFNLSMLLEAADTRDVLTAAGTTQGYDANQLRAYPQARGCPEIGQ